jgi:hypothetical protein
MNGATANEMVEKCGGLVAFGRHFITNVSRVFVGWRSHFSQRLQPDIPLRLKEGFSLTRYNRDTFYATEAAAG